MAPFRKQTTNNPTFMYVKLPKEAQDREYCRQTQKTKKEDYCRNNHEQKEPTNPGKGQRN